MAAYNQILSPIVIEVASGYPIYLSQRQKCLYVLKSRPRTYPYAFFGRRDQVVYPVAVHISNIAARQARDLYDLSTVGREPAGFIPIDLYLAFAAFVAMRPVMTFTLAEKEHIIELLNARREPQGVPLRWDLILVKRGSF